MERIGLVASRIAKGNLFLYNLFVVLLVALFFLLVFFICGASIIIVLVALDYASKAKMMPEVYQSWIPPMIIALSCLGVIVGLFAVAALGKNFKWRRNK